MNGNKLRQICYAIIFFALTFCILAYSELSLSYAALGLRLWFDKMVPALFPFMIISGIMIRLNLTEIFVSVIYPPVRQMFHITRNVCYCLLIGFLCGFPMGAKTAADLYSFRKISRWEARYLLCFVNNIGPVYFLGFVLPLLHRKMILPYLTGMYLIPLLYGLFLRYTFFRDKLPASEEAARRYNILKAADFKSVIGGLVEQLNTDLNAPDQLMDDLMLDKADIHDVMAAINKSEIQLNMASTALGKVIQTYEKIMQISI